jgi:hypothetical protein
LDIAIVDCIVLFEEDIVVVASLLAEVEVGHMFEVEVVLGVG